MDHQRLEEIGEKLRSLGHERREVVEEIISDASQGAGPDARRLYRDLDRISEECISLMQKQRDMIAGEIQGGHIG